MSLLRTRPASPLRGLLLALFLPVLVASTLPGCATYVQPEAPRPPIPSEPATDAEQVAIGDTIEDLPEKLGFNLFTLFAIPVGRLHLNPNLAQPRLVEGVERALERAGREPVDPAEHPDAPQLIAKVRRMRFHAYRWFFPVTIVWGRMELSFALTDAAGTTRWERTYEVRSRQAGLARVIDDVVNGAFHEAISRAARDFASKEFGDACRTRSLGPPVGAPSEARHRDTRD